VFYGPPFLPGLPVSKYAVLLPGMANQNKRTLKTTIIFQNIIIILFKQYKITINLLKYLLKHCIKHTFAKNRSASLTSFNAPHL